MPGDNTAAKRVVLRCHPEGHVKVTDFAVEPAAVPDLTDGTFLVRNLFVSVDPMLRIFIDRSPLGNIGNAQAAGTLGSANALSGGLQGVGNSLLMSTLLGRGGGGGIYNSTGGGSG